MTKETKKGTPVFDSLKGAYDSMGDILEKAETGTADPSTLAKDLNLAIVNYFGGVDEKKMNAFSQPYQTQLINGITNYNTALEQMKDLPRSMQPRGEILNGLENAVGGITQTFFKGVSETAAKEMGIKVTSDDKEELFTKKLMNALAESYKK
ncbi:hypothetical protein HOE22_02960 [Candidatus Woesearchaeota archaeon]|jgi:hypothetical protein|nr:hypothetical protein [Candidatus Woesearchaeota archaeon]MBT3438598.1 hypothetical protein [Candidatus Woesearchaeota archaeon]MBT4058504.1 hypothetical protein [Candidatus Woesearchaeota archaeon]MBT4207283.1 hypothetical protein [Candidatus Woesearchaeota archaeon]MBT4733195.1 hypothetical protein [Candidatus Woesearchaeota archaeon]